MGKRGFIIDTGENEIPVEGHEHRNVAVKYLMKRRRTLLSTRDSQKIEILFDKLPRELTIIGKLVSRTYYIKWEKVGTEEFTGSRFTFTINEKVKLLN